jgi:hypothetical protein
MSSFRLKTENRKLKTWTVPVPFSETRGTTAIAIALHRRFMSRPGDMQKLRASIRPKRCANARTRSARRIP